MRQIKYRHAQSAFSLLELILVVTVIGILSAVALQKFIPLTADAHLSVLQGMQSSLEDAAGFTYNKAVLAGKETQPSALVAIKSGRVLDANDPFVVFTRYGYPQGVWSEIIKIIELDEIDWLYSNQQSGTINQPASVYLWTKQGPGSISRCNISYQGALDSGFRPQIIINETGC